MNPPPPPAGKNSKKLPLSKTLREGREPDVGPPGVTFDQPTDGTIYGRPPPKVDESLPNLAELFEAANIPPPGTEDNPPHPPEWYADAPGRMKMMEREMESLMQRKASLRGAWGASVCTGLEWTHEKIQEISGGGTDPLDLRRLIAQTAHERPWDTEEVQRLRNLDAQFVDESTRLRLALTELQGTLLATCDSIVDREAQDVSEDRARKEAEDAIKARKKAAEKYLKRQAALLRGEDPDELEGDEDSASQSQAPSREVASTAPSHASLAAAGAAVADKLLRGGSHRELPPLPQRPPLPPMK